MCNSDLVEGIEPQLDPLTFSIFVHLVGTGKMR